MSGCCTPRGYRQIFSEKNARGEAKRYRRKGLDGRLALQRRFVKLRQRGSHVIFRVGDGTVTFAYHDRVELADRQLRRIAGDFGISLEDLKKLL